MRCIDVDALKKNIIHALGIESEAYLLFGAEKKIWQLIENAPTIEPDWNEMLVICDNCGHAIHVKREDAKSESN